MERRRVDVADRVRKLGKRMTVQRRLVLEALDRARHHTTAAEIASRIRRQHPQIDPSTVYRNLELLVRCGLVHQVRLPGRRVVYEHLHPGQRHDHLSCRRCGRIVEFVSPGIAALLGEICRAHGFEAAAVQLQISARCRDCAGEAERATDASRPGAVAHA